jgi:hypothetical protein
MLEKETSTLIETRKDTSHLKMEKERNKSHQKMEKGHLIKIGFNNSKMKCFFCKKPGHHIKDYKARITKDSRNSTRQTNVAINLTSCIL